jgi:hypothetical protein
MKRKATRANILPAPPSVLSSHSTMRYQWRALPRIAFLTPRWTRKSARPESSAGTGPPEVPGVEAPYVVPEDEGE